MLGLDPQGHRDDCPNPVHEVVPLQVQQDELLGGLCKVGLQPQDAEQREHHLGPVANGSLQAQGTAGHPQQQRGEEEDQLGRQELSAASTQQATLLARDRVHKKGSMQLSCEGQVKLARGGLQIAGEQLFPA